MDVSGHIGSPAGDHDVCRPYFFGLEVREVDWCTSFGLGCGLDWLPRHCGLAHSEPVVHHPSDADEPGENGDCEGEGRAAGVEGDDGESHASGEPVACGGELAGWLFVAHG